MKLVAASNWDVSLHEQLERTGLTPLLDGALSSAEVGAPKPDPEIFTRALALAGGASRRRRCTSATTSRPTSAARSRPG